MYVGVWLMPRFRFPYNCFVPPTGFSPTTSSLWGCSWVINVEAPGVGYRTKKIEKPPYVVDTIYIRIYLIRINLPLSVGRRNKMDARGWRVKKDTFDISIYRTGRLDIQHYEAHAARC